MLVMPQVRDAMMTSWMGADMEVLGLGFAAEEVEDFWIAAELVVEFGEGELFEFLDGAGADAGAGGDVPDGNAAGCGCSAGALICGEGGEAGVDLCGCFRVEHGGSDQWAVISEQRFGR